MNGREIEAKFYVNEIGKIEMRLQALKAHLIQPRTHEINLRFDTAEAVLRRTGRVLRLRQDDRARMTYKGSGVNQAGVISREEIEFVVEDFERAKRFLEALGYEAVVFYEKFRTTYELTGSHIMLDEVPYGRFVEIEGKDDRSVREMAHTLGLAWVPLEASYISLFEQVCRAVGLHVRDLSFANFEGVEVSAADLGATPAG